MPIIETRTHTRPSTATPLWSDSTGPALTAAMAAIQPFIDNGTLTLNRTISDDGLTITQILTYSDLETYSAVDTIFGLELNAEFMQYTSTHGISNDINTYQMTGIDQLFTNTISYNFAAGTMIDGYLLVDFLPTKIAGDKLQDLSVTETNITAVLLYDNSADYTQNAWLDLQFVERLHAAGVTRSISYSLFV